MKKGLRIFLYVIAGLFVLGIIGQLVNPSQPGDTSTPSPTEPVLTQAQKDSIQAAEAKAIKDNTIPAANLVAYYLENEVKADQDLKDKEFYVSGKIDNIAKDITNDIYVTLKSNDLVRNVQCFIEDENVAANLKKGQKVLIKGTCKGLMMNVLMKDCVVVE